MKFVIHILFYFYISIAKEGFSAEIEVSFPVDASDSSSPRQSALPIIEDFQYVDSDSTIGGDGITVKNGSIVENSIMHLTTHAIFEHLQEAFDRPLTPLLPLELSQIIAAYSRDTTAYATVKTNDAEFDLIVNLTVPPPNMESQATRILTTLGHFKFAKPIDTYSSAESRADKFETLFRTHLYIDKNSNIILMFDMTSNTEIVSVPRIDENSSYHDQSSNIIPFSINGRFYSFQNNTFSIFDDLNDLLTADTNVRSFFKDKRFVCTYSYTLSKDLENQDLNTILVKDTRTNNLVQILNIGKEPFQVDLVDGNLVVTCEDSIYQIYLNRLSCYLKAITTVTASSSASAASA